MKKGELIKLLAEIPDDVEISIELNDESPLSWQRWQLSVMVDTSVCYGYEGCKHTSPEPFNECTFIISRKQQV